MTAPERVLLLGMMGAGKTTVGRALAGRTGWPYYDNDELVTRTTGRAAPDLLEAGGEDALRAAESAALGAALSLPAPLVAGVAGGVVLDPADRERLRTAEGLVVWLRARIGTLAERVGTGEGRSWLQPDPAAALAELAAVREPLYAAVADLVVDVDEASPEEVAATVLARRAP